MSSHPHVTAVTAVEGRGEGEGGGLMTYEWGTGSQTVTPSREHVRASRASDVSVRLGGRC
jgi:hypothetical protein